MSSSYGSDMAAAKSTRTGDDGRARGVFPPNGIRVASPVGLPLCRLLRFASWRFG
jgi:hypothetical protein